MIFLNTDRNRENMDTRKFQGSYILLVLVTIQLTSYVEITETRKSEPVKYFYYPKMDVLQEIFINETPFPVQLNQYNETFIIVDGFLSNISTNMCQTVKNNTLATYPDSNVFMIEWSEFSGSKSLKWEDNLSFGVIAAAYKEVRTHVEFVGQKVAEFLEYLERLGGINLSKVHVVGFSVGAHIAGVAGLKFQENYKKRINRITALDPAGPGFSMKTPNTRLDKSDADFVDVYFTNRYIVGDTEHGVGHVNIFVNGGRKQPGCESKSLVDSTICNHSFAWKLWNYCMTGKCTSCPCLQKECQNCSGTCTNGIHVGAKLSPNGERGDFYLKTGPLK